MLKPISLAILLSAVVAFSQAPTAPTGKPLPPGPMQPKVKAACTQCHAPDRITEQHLSRDQWSDELKKMEALGAVIPDTDRASMLNYLVKNFGPPKGGKSAVKKAAN